MAKRGDESDSTLNLISAKHYIVALEVGEVPLTRQPHLTARHLLTVQHVGSVLVVFSYFPSRTIPREATFLLLRLVFGHTLLFF